MAALSWRPHSCRSPRRSKTLSVEVNHRRKFELNLRDSKRNSSPWSQFTFGLRNAAPNASAPELPHDALQHLGNPRRLTRGSWSRLDTVNTSETPGTSRSSSARWPEKSSSNRARTGSDPILLGRGVCSEIARREWVWIPKRRSRIRDRHPACAPPWSAAGFGCLFCLDPVLIARVTRRFAFVGSSFYRCAAVGNQAAWCSWHHVKPRHRAGRLPGRGSRNSCRTTGPAVEQLPTPKVP